MLRTGLLLMLALGPPPSDASDASEANRSVELSSSLRDAGVGEQQSLLDVEAPSAGLRSVGGLGRFGALSPRPTGGAQVFLEGAPLTTGLTGIVDLPAALDDDATVQIHRSYVPVSYGAAAWAGQALDLRGRLYEQERPRAWATAGLGSFLTRELRGGFAVGLRPHLSLDGRVGYLGSRGDFPYFDNGGSPLLFGDDDRRRRASNDYDSTLAQLRLVHRRGALELASVLRGGWRTQSVPQAFGARPSDVRLSTFSLRSVTRVRHGLDRPNSYVEWIASVAAEGRLLRDPKPALGRMHPVLGRIHPTIDDERGVSVDAWLSPRVRTPLWMASSLLLSAELRSEHVDIRERASMLDPAQVTSGDARRTRYSAGIGVELEQWLFERRWRLLPAMRVDLFSNRFAVPRGEGEPSIPEGTSARDAGIESVAIGFSPKLSTEFALLPPLEKGQRAADLKLRGSVGRYMRAPTLVELFGDRGYLLGNEGLTTESGTRIDGALEFELLEPHGRPHRLFAQLLGYATWSNDLIQWVRIQGATAQPINIERARMRGLEFSTRWSGWRDAMLVDLSYVLRDGTNSSPSFASRDTPIPGWPRHQLRVRPSGGHRFVTRGASPITVAPRMFYEFEWISASTLDERGYEQSPARLLHAAGVSLRLAARVEIGLELRNIGNAGWALVNDEGAWPGPYPVAVGDLLGFPLPSRSVWLSVRVDAGGDRPTDDQPTRR